MCIRDRNNTFVYSKSGRKTECFIFSYEFSQFPVSYTHLACAPQDTLVRVALMATHTVEQVDYAVEKLTKCFKELGIIK